MNASLIRTNSLVAFAFTVIAVTFYFIIFLMLVSLKNEHAMFPSTIGHLGVVWVPVVLSAVLYFWATKNMPLPCGKRLTQIVVCAILAPIISGSFIFFFGFTILGWEM